MHTFIIVAVVAVVVLYLTRKALLGGLEAQSLGHSFWKAFTAVLTDNVKAAFRRG